MDPKRLSHIETQLLRAVLVTWIISAAIMLFLLSSLDTIVNTELYNFGLQLSAEWILPYWTYLRLNYALLGISMALSLFALALGFFRKKEQVAEHLIRQPPKPQPFMTGENKPRESNSTVSKLDTTGLISCLSCGRKFGRPLVSLKFEGGKNRLVNVCPYCSHVLPNEISEQTKKAIL